MKIELVNNRWYLVTPKGTRLKTMFLREVPESKVIKFFKERYGLMIEPRQLSLKDV